VNATLARWLVTGEWRSHPVRALVSIAAIATGVALGFAVHLVNGSAMLEFGSALGAISGNADMEIVSRSGSGFAEDLYPAIARLPEVAVAAPILETRVALANSPVVLDVIGTDPLTAARLNPIVAAASSDTQSTLGLFRDSSIFISSEALARLHKKVGDTLDVVVAGRSIGLEITGTFSSSNADLALMDIGNAQWRLQRPGVLSRIAIARQQNASLAELQKAVLALLPADTTLVLPSDREHRTDQLSRAYRFNLDMLALMALFTGGFLVYSTQSLSVMRRRQQIAFLRILGASRLEMLGQILVEGAMLGAIGSAMGLALGGLSASAVLRVFGPDLGGGYFSERPTPLHFTPWAALVFFALGLVAALLGSWFPARQLEKMTPAESLKAQDDSVDPRVRPGILQALFLALGALAVVFLPAIDGLPLFGSLAIALVLFAGIAAMPCVVRSVISSISPYCVNAALPVTLALKRLWGAPSQGTVALCGVVASVSLMVSMAVMVTSFRDSVDAWVVQILPADLYLHVSGPGESLGLDAPTQSRLRALSGVASVDFLKVVPLALAPDRPAVSLLARDYGGEFPTGLPIISATAPLLPGADPVWISEALADLYGWRIGELRQLPLSDVSGKSREVSIEVRGIWRDYARQTGAIVMKASDYSRETGDTQRSDAAITLASQASLAEVKRDVLATLGPDLQSAASVTTPRDIRQTSLAIFDRSFFITYLLEAVAIGIGLAGVAATFSAQTIARSHEFGMLRHLGVTHVEILSMLASEGLILGMIGVAAGALIGLLQGQILIKVVNPQSFHWGMETHIPLALLGFIVVAMLLASAGIAVVAGRSALSVATLRAVRDDW